MNYKILENKKFLIKIKNEIPNVNVPGNNIIITGATEAIGKKTARSLVDGE